MTGKPAVLVDLDGVVWRGDAPIPGADRGVSRFVDAGCYVAYFTNNSNATRADIESKLARQGIAVDDADILSSAAAAASLLAAGERALVVGGPGCIEALSEAGVVAVLADGKGESEGFDAVVVGIDFAFDYARLSQAMAALLAGARLIGTNDDATFPVPGRELPGGGSILAAVSTASRAVPVVAGKPHEAAVDLVRSRLGSVGLVVGDRPSTDGAFARRLDAQFALVYSGVTSRGDQAIDPPPDRVGDDLLAIAREWVNERGNRQTG